MEHANQLRDAGPPPPAEPDGNFRNHLAFLATHRGRVRTGANSVALDGEAAFLSFFSPTGDDSGLPADCGTAWLYPWSGGSWPGRLEQAGFAPAEQLAYMQLGTFEAPAATARPPIERVASEPAAAEFAAVQARGFLTDDGPEREWWIACFARMARRNHRLPDQAFLLARVGTEPAAVLLTVRTGDTTGIYAVATAPEHRGKGLSTALLQRALEDAAASGSTDVVLQVMAGSYAHGFYRRLGFADRYLCQVWRKA